MAAVLSASHAAPAASARPLDRDLRGYLATNADVVTRVAKPVDLEHIPALTAQSERPAQQGLNAVMETFIVSFGTCTLTALTVMLSGVIDWSLPEVERATSTAAVGLAFNSAMPGVGGYLVAFCVFLFGYGTLIGWAYYGEQFLEYWLGPRVVMPYRWIYCLLIPFGAIAKVKLVWAWGDLMNALQIFPNLIGVIGLSALVARAARAKRE